MSATGKVCILTGASSGIGRATALGLAKLGITVVAAIRGDGGELIQQIKSQASNSQVEVMKIDLSSQSSIRNFAQEFNQKFDHLDVLINNAGVFNTKRKLTEDGVESTFAVNVVAPFLLTNLLVDKLKESAPSRIVNVSSDSANGTHIDFDNLQGEKKYSTFGQYGKTKLALNLLTVEFSRRLAGTGVSANFLHPGFVRTNLGGRNLNPVAKALFRFIQLFGLSPEAGAKTSVYLATSPQVEGITGKYFVKEREATANPESFDEKEAARLWQICEELTSKKTQQQPSASIAS